MMYQEIRHKSVPSLSFMKNTDYVIYVGPKLSWFKYRKFRSRHMKVPVIYFPELLGKENDPGFFLCSYQGRTRHSGQGSSESHARIISSAISLPMLAGLFLYSEVN